MQRQVGRETLAQARFRGCTPAEELLWQEVLFPGAVVRQPYLLMALCVAERVAALAASCRRGSHKLRATGEKSFQEQKSNDGRKWLGQDVLLARYPKYPLLCPW